MTWANILQWMGATSTNLAVEIALMAMVVYVLLTVVMVRYASQNYTRVPGSGWTTWERAEVGSRGDASARGRTEADDDSCIAS